jgi:DNA-binding transcriptional ArsR family regulator
MATDQDSVSRLLSALSHPLRREILLLLDEKDELSFTDLMNSLNVDTGKLSFHIRGLTEFLEQTSTGKYRLGKLGIDAIVFIRDIDFTSRNAGETNIRFPN